MIERRRREYQGAEGAEEGKVWGGGVPILTGKRSRKEAIIPIHTGENVWGGAMPSPQKTF